MERTSIRTGRRTATVAAAPARSSMARCSRTSPCSASTPIVGPVMVRS